MKSCRRVRAALSRHGRVLQGGAGSSQVQLANCQTKRREAQDGFGCCGLQLGNMSCWGNWRGCVAMATIESKFESKFYFSNDFGKTLALGQRTQPLTAV